MNLLFIYGGMYVHLRSLTSMTGGEVLNENISMAVYCMIERLKTMFRGKKSIIIPSPDSFYIL